MQHKWYWEIDKSYFIYYFIRTGVLYIQGALSECYLYAKNVCHALPVL